MADVIKFKTMSKFAGINNVDDATRLDPIVVGHEYVHPLQQANNIDIDNTFGLSSRSGYDDVLTGTDIHSLWSDNVTCLYVDGVTLKQLSTLYAATSLRIGLTAGARMSYAPFNSRIYYTNAHEIGYVYNSTSVLLTDPAMEFKHPLPPGKFIEYYRGCLYVADENVLYMSDPLCDYFDTRYGYKQFAYPITLLRAVDDGLYVGDDRVWWVNGKSGDEFDRQEAYPSRPISYTDVKVNGQYLGSGLKGNVAIWTGENGICIGTNDGTVANQTEQQFTFTPASKGAGFIRENGNVRHYINSLY